MRFDSEAALVYRRLLTYVKPHRGVMALAIVAMLLYAGADALFPLLMQQVVETLESDGRQGNMLIPIAIVAIFVARGVFGFMSTYGLGWMGRRVIQQMRSQIFDHYLGLPARYYDQSSAGVLLSKLTYNTEQVAESISNVIVTLVRDLFTILGLVAVMIYLSPALTGLIFLVAPTIALLIRYLSKVFRRYSSRIQNSMGDVTQVAEEVIGGQRIVKVFNGQEYEQRQFESVNRSNFKLNMKLVAARAFGDSVTQLLAAAGVAGVIFLAFSESMFSSLDTGTFTGFLTAMAMLMAPLKRVTNINVALQRGIAAGMSLFELLDEPREVDQGTRTLESPAGNIEFRDVHFAYASEKGPVLRSFSLEIAAGKTIAIVGRSGSGKSTLVSLVPRFYDPVQGAILLDGVDVRDLALKDLRRHISMVSQDVVLFNDTIANNIAYGGLTGAPRSEVDKAAEAAYVAEFANELPDGLETVVGERGVLLSGGQRQRIAIARALLKNAPVLILDEATSALDTESERHIQRALDRLMRNRTTLVIAHRLSTVEGADEIVVLDHGTLVERGTHAELLARGGHYAALYQMQFSE